MGDSDIHPNDVQLVELFRNGETQIEIARRMGLTRERVRQRLARNGLAGRSYGWAPPKSALEDALRRAESLEHAAGILGLERHRFEKAVELRGLEGVLTDARQRWRESSRDDRRDERRWITAATILRLALKIRHTPTSEELAAYEISHVEMSRLWGSVPEAMRAAGLVPNQVGRAPSPLPDELANVLEPTADARELDRRAWLLIDASEPNNPPPGCSSPGRTTVTCSAFVCDPAVAAWVLQEASGQCESCREMAYETDSGRSYLEIHHVIPLDEGGSDTVANAVGVCETCHGKLHRWVHRASLKQSLYDRIDRLKPA
jgi:5-methylcytosine-specific restriction endonuclease McrA